MEPVVIEALVVLLTKAVPEVLRKRKAKSDNRKAAKLISEAVAELLTLRPNLNIVQAKLATAEAKATDPSADLLRAQEMLVAVRGSVASAPAARRSAKKKATKKKPRRKTKRAKKAVRKKAKKKLAKKKVRRKKLPRKKPPRKEPPRKKKARRKKIVARKKR